MALGVTVLFEKMRTQMCCTELNFDEMIDEGDHPWKERY